MGGITQGEYIENLAGGPALPTAPNPPPQVPGPREDGIVPPSPPRACPSCPPDRFFLGLFLGYVFCQM